MSPSQAKKKLNVLVKVVAWIYGGLGGEPFAWGQGEAMHYCRIAKELGFELVTKTMVKRKGHRLKRNAKPVGSAYYGAPIQRHCDLYILWVHTKLEKNDPN